MKTFEFLLIFCHKKVAEDLTKIMKEAVKSDIFILIPALIFSRLGNNSPWTYKYFDNNTLGLGKQKYSLVYYLSVGDQNSSEPGIFKLYEPDEEFSRMKV